MAFCPLENPTSNCTVQNPTQACLVSQLVGSSRDVLLCFDQRCRRRCQMLARAAQGEGGGRGWKFRSWGVCRQRNWGPMGESRACETRPRGRGREGSSRPHLGSAARDACKHNYQLGRSLRSYPRFVDRWRPAGSKLRDFSQEGGGVETTGLSGCSFKAPGSKEQRRPQRACRSGLGPPDPGHPECGPAAKGLRSRGRSQLRKARLPATRGEPRVRISVFSCESAESHGAGSDRLPQTSPEVPVT